MKNLYLVILLITALSFSASSQVILLEDFEMESLPIYVASGYDTIWVNEDLDQLPDASPQGRPDEWYIDTAFSLADSVDQVAMSNSWTNITTTPISNYLITPPIHLFDNTGELSWFVASYQQPRYVDGMQILVSTTGNDVGMFTDTLKQYGEYISGAALQFDSSFLSGGYVFSSNGFVLGSDYQYVEYYGDSARFRGILRPDTVSLAQYAGQTIYIAFCHGTTDDNLISIDDICVTGAGTVYAPMPSENNFSLSAYPNPASDKFTIQYNLPVTGSVDLYLMDVTGKKVKTILNNMCIKGDYTFDIDIKELTVGIYSLILVTPKGESISQVTKM